MVANRNGCVVSGSTGCGESSLDQWSPPRRRRGSPIFTCVLPRISLKEAISTGGGSLFAVNMSSCSAEELRSCSGIDWRET